MGCSDFRNSMRLFRRMLLVQALLIVTTTAAAATTADDNDDWFVHSNITDSQQTQSRELFSYIGPFSHFSGMTMNIRREQTMKQQMMKQMRPGSNTMRNGAGKMMMMMKQNKQKMMMMMRRRDQQTTIRPSQKLGRQGLCVIGCSPYVDLDRDDTGVLKYKALVHEMAKTCDILVHVGDTKPPDMACNRTTIARSVHWLRAAAKRQGKIALYAPGDNEILDCHRSASARNADGSAFVMPADFYRASQARDYLVESLRLGPGQDDKAQQGRDLTLKYPVDTHYKFRNSDLVPGTNYTYRCDFDKYVELDHYAVATLEVPGSQWYMHDETQDGYPLQDQVDPLMDRLGLYLNAMECAVDWIESSAEKASLSGKRALFFAFQGMFYANYGIGHMSQSSTGFYSKDNFARYMRDIAGRTNVTDAYQPLYDKLTEVALRYRKIQFYAIHADGHRFQTLRLNPNLSNRGGAALLSNHNLRAHMVEGTARALTMWSRFTVDPDSFQPVTLKEEWSKYAFSREPLGHAWLPYAPPVPQ